MGNLFTIAGKALAFLVLIIGIGGATFAAVTYTQRPGWFEPVPEGVQKGQRPLTFAMMSAEINAAGKAATTASAAWGAEFQTLKAAEDTREKRRVLIRQRLADGQKGDPGFYQYKSDPATGLLDLTDTSTPVKGPDDRNLKGAENLLATYSTTVDEIDRLVRESTKLRRDDLKRLGDEIVLTENRLMKQRDSREQLQNEAAYLASLEINVAEQQATATRRLEQLKRRLEIFKLP